MLRKENSKCLEPRKMPAFRNKIPGIPIDDKLKLAWVKTSSEVAFVFLQGRRNPCTNGPINLSK